MQRIGKKIRIGRTCVLIGLACLASGWTVPIGAKVLLYDGMDYTDDAALRSAWQRVYENWITIETQPSYGPTPLAAVSDTPASGSYASLANGVVYRRLPETVAGNWSLSVKLLQSTYKRAQSVFLLNDAGTQGYGFLWDSSIVNVRGGNGFYQIRKFDNSSHGDWSSFGTGSPLGSAINGSHPATGYPVTGTVDDDANSATYDTASWADFVSLRLDWVATTGELSLYEDNVLIGQVSDTSFSDFRRIYLRGNTSGFFDDVQLTTDLVGYDKWAADYPTLIGGPSDNDDNDALSNLEEFAMGGNPTNASDIGYVPSYKVAGDFFELIHVRRTTPGNDLLYYLEQNEDLVASPPWQRTGKYEISGTNSFSSDPDFEVVTNRIPIVGKPQEFVRLAIANRSDPFAGLMNTGTFGATVPFVTLEGEDASATSGSVVELGAPYPWPSVPAQEASGRAYVELDSTGEYVEFNVPAAANAMVIRHCIPDAPAGGGITATLGLYVNGTRVQDISLSSKFNWLYVTSGPYDNGQSNTPNGSPHVFWDETRLFISGGVSAGDTIRLQKDAGDTAAYYRIDLVELEEVPPPLEQPPNSLSVADFGADGSSADNDTVAIQNCIDAAIAQGKSVWLPPGTYLQNEYFSLTGVKLQGAGMWYTTVSDVVGNAATTWMANSGFLLREDGAGVSDLTFNSIANTYRHANAPKSFMGAGANWSIERVWVTHTGTGVWVTGVNGVIRDCRIRFTYADGINVNDGNINFLDNVLVENNHVRGTGDDGIAVLAHTASPGKVSRITVRHNTVVAPWWASNMDMTGGSDILMHNNVLTDGGGFVVNMPSAYPMEPLENALFAYNKIRRCGYYSVGGDQRRGSIWIYPGTGEIHDFRIENNELESALYHGIEVVGYKYQEILFKDNTINNSDRKAVLIGSTAKGIGTFEGNVSTGSGDSTVFLNTSGTYTVVDDGSNTWD